MSSQAAACWVWALSTAVQTCTKRPLVFFFSWSNVSYILIFLQNTINVSRKEWDKEQEKWYLCSPDLPWFTLVFTCPNRKSTIICGKPIKPQQKKKRPCIESICISEGWSYNMFSYIYKIYDPFLRKMQVGFPLGIRKNLALNVHSEWQPLLGRSQSEDLDWIFLNKSVCPCICLAPV